MASISEYMPMHVVCCCYDFLKSYGLRFHELDPCRRWPSLFVMPQTQAQGTYLPTRLIDVGANNSTNLRLVLSKDDEYF